MKEGSEILIKEMSSNGVLRLTMNNLDHKNALSETMMSILLDELKEASTDKSIRTIVLSANGNVFCSGHDLKEITAARANEDNGEVFFQKLFDHCSSLMQLIVKTPQPVIAEVDGIATAAGCQLVASCDLAIASDESIASENVIVLPFTVYAELGDCITPLTETINCSAIKFGCGTVLIFSVYDESLVPVIASIL